MKKSSRILILILVLSLTAVYFVPLWNISLDAPQYPEGLSMQIWLSKITGDLQTINGLNHYIGMKTIQPDSIQELKLMPYIIGFIILAGFMVYLFNKKILLLSWILIIIITGIAGMYDFWLWEYDYGHNLDPTAAIIVSGMNYQPPLIGSKELLNFTAVSMPDIGGIIIFAVGIIGIMVLLYEYKYNKIQNVKMNILLILLIFLLACSKDISPLEYGKDQCDHCRMTLEDRKYGAEIITKKGKAVKFDAAECMLKYLKEKKIDENDVEKYLVIDLNEPGVLTNAVSATYLISSKLRSPMGENISSFKDKNTALKNSNEYGGEIFSWEELKNKFR